MVPVGAPWGIQGRRVLLWLADPGWAASAERGGRPGTGLAVTLASPEFVAPCLSFPTICIFSKYLAPTLSQAQGPRDEADTASVCATPASVAEKAGSVCLAFPPSPW